MSLALLIESTSVKLSLGLCKDYELLWSGEEVKGKNLSQIQVLLDQGLIDTGTSINELRDIAFDSGPGSYTSLRVGIAFAIGLAYSRNIPLYPIPKSKIMFGTVSHLDFENIITAIHARQDIYHITHFNREGKVIHELRDNSHGLLRLYEKMENGVLISDHLDQFKTKDEVPNSFINFAPDALSLLKPFELSSKNKEFIPLEQIKPIYFSEPGLAK